MNGNFFYYFATDQWRYDSLDAAEILSPSRRQPAKAPRDYNVIAARLGCFLLSAVQPEPPRTLSRAMDSAPGLTRRSYLSCGEAQAAGGLPLLSRIRTARRTSPPPLLWRQISGRERQGPRVLPEHLLGTDNAVLNQESGLRRRNSVADPAPEGKLDLLVTLELRCPRAPLCRHRSSCRGWYEMHDLRHTDFTPYRSFQPASIPVEARPTGSSSRHRREVFRACGQTPRTAKDLMATRSSTTPRRDLSAAGPGLKKAKGPRAWKDAA